MWVDFEMPGLQMSEKSPSQWSIKLTVILTVFFVRLDRLTIDHTITR